MSEESIEVLRSAWSTYHATLESLRLRVEATSRFKNKENQAKAYHALLEAQAMAYRLALPSRTDPPIIDKNLWFADIYTLGGNSPDFNYGSFILDGRRRYKISGRFADQKFIVMQGYSHLLGHADSKMLGNFDVSEYDVNEDGSFEITFCAERCEGNWIALDPDSRFNFFFMRRAVEDWNDDLGNVQIEALDESPSYPELDLELQAERILLAADVTSFMINQWVIGVYDDYLQINKGQKNQIKVIAGSTLSKDKMGSPSTYYLAGVFELEDDEAMVVEYTAPQAHLWSFQIYDVWCKPMGFVHHQTDINMRRAQLSSDGKVRYVISKEDIGVANWLDTVGRKEGLLVGRSYLAKEEPEEPVVKILKISDVLSYLPEDTATVSSKERQQSLKYRRDSYLKMVDEIKS